MSTENALDRLKRLSESSNEPEYTLDEQLDSVSTDDFLDGMSFEAKNELGHLLEEVVVEEEPTNVIENLQKQVNEEKQIQQEVQQELKQEVQTVKEEPKIPKQILQAVEQEENPEETVEKQNIEENSNKGLFNNNTVKPKRKYVRRDKSKNEVETSTNEGVTVEKQTPVPTNQSSNMNNPVFDQLAKDLIDDLKKSKYKINRFDEQSMLLILNYMYSKF